MNPQSSAPKTNSLNILSNLSVKNMREMLHTTISPVAIHWFGMSFVVVILLWLITYVTTKLNLNRTNCLSIQSYYNEPTKITSAWTSLNSKDYQKNLRDFYIKTAYNCCASGQYKNDYVSLCALHNTIVQGCRCLDFEIYCLNDAPVVAVSSIDQVGVKQSYNALPISDVLNDINTYAFSEVNVPTDGKNPRYCPNPKDPLLLHFRLKTNKVNILNQLAAEIAQTLGNRLLPIDYMREYNGKNITKVPINVFLGKVVIMVEKSNTSQGMPILYQSKNLWELTNVTTNSAFIHEKFFTDIKNTTDPQDIIEFNRQNMTIVLPDLAEYDINYIYTVPQVLGCQLMAMSFQSHDQNLVTYNAFFEQAGSAFVMKPDSLLYVPTFIDKPEPLSPRLNTATRYKEVPGLGMMPS
jgi:hypothetical protein